MMTLESAESKNIITIGASAGGLEAVTRLVKTFKNDMDAAIFIVIHLSSHSNSDVIIKFIQQNSAFRCLVPSDQQEIETKTIYLAPTNHHMLIEKGRIRVTKGAAENHYRPSIDVLFRSAAAAYSSCVTGIILTGLLDDGTSGMIAIKRCGGICIVQDPKEAAFTDMPTSVLQNVNVDFSVPISAMSDILNNRLSGPKCVQKEVPADIKLEADIARRLTTSMSDLAALGDFTPLTCPSCGGAMVKIEDESSPRYRCYTGHTFTEKFLEIDQMERIEESLWVSIRIIEERKHLLMTMNSFQQPISGEITEHKDTRITGMQMHIDTLRNTLLALDTSTGSN